MLQSPRFFFQLLIGAVTCCILASHSDEPSTANVDEQKDGKIFQTWNQMRRAAACYFDCVLPEWGDGSLCAGLTDFASRYQI
jgi:hypothetical protein